MKLEERNDRYGIKIGGRFVSYLKRVKYGEPAVDFQPWPAVYKPNVARGWLTTCQRRWPDAEMVRLAYNSTKGEWEQAS